MENPALIAIFANALSPPSPLLPSHALTVIIAGKTTKMPRPRGCNGAPNHALVHALVVLQSMLHFML